MILHELIIRHLKHRDDGGFYLLQAQDAIRWMETCGVTFGPSTSVLDLGCGHGVFGAELIKKGCPVTFADEANFLFREISQAPFRQINIDREDVSKLGTFDLVICSNVLEHLSKPDQFISAAGKLLNSKGRLYLSWTNWLSPWGGHEFSPFHYLGARHGHLIYDKWVRRPRKHTPFENLFPTYIGHVLSVIGRRPDLRVIKVAPRYYTELACLMRIPVLREFLAWNCAMLIEKTR